MLFSATHPRAASMCHQFHQSQRKEHFSWIISTNSRLKWLFRYSCTAGAKLIKHQVLSQKLFVFFFFNALITFLFEMGRMQNQEKVNGCIRNQKTSSRVTLQKGQLQQPAQKRTAGSEGSDTLSAASAGWRLCIRSLRARGNRLLVWVGFAATARPNWKPFEFCCSVLWPSFAATNRICTRGLFIELASLQREAPHVVTGQRALFTDSGRKGKCLFESPKLPPCGKCSTNKKTFRSVFKQT